MPLLESCSSRDNDEEQIVVADSRLDSRVSLLACCRFFEKKSLNGSSQIDRMEIPFSLSGVEQVEDIRG